MVEGFMLEVPAAELSIAGRPAALQGPGDLQSCSWVRPSYCVFALSTLDTWLQFGDWMMCLKPVA